MNEVLSKSHMEILKVLFNVISSQASVDGVLHFDSQDGQTIDLSGRVAHHVNPLVLLESSSVKKMNDTSGPCSSISLVNSNLQQFLVSKLQVQLKQSGSMIYKLTWKKKTTPRGWSYSQLAASVHRIKGNDSGSYPTPSTRDHKGGYKGGRIRNGKLSTDTLDVVAQLVPWATPNTMDHLPKRSPEAMQHQYDTARKGRTAPSNLREMVHDDCYPGKIPTPSFMGMENTVPSQLNPRFSLWLMGYPIKWVYCGEQVTPLSRKSRQK